MTAIVPGVVDAQRSALFPSKCRGMSLSSLLLPLLRWLWLWRLIGIVLANLDPLGISVGVGKLMLAGGLVVLLDYAHVPLLVHWPEDANALPDHAVEAESFL